MLRSRVLASTVRVVTLVVAHRRRSGSMMTIGGTPSTAGMPCFSSTGRVLGLGGSIIALRGHPELARSWIVAIGDKAKNIVARSQRHAELSGTSWRLEFFAKSVGRSGAFTAMSIDGMPVLPGYYNSPFSGWVFVAAVPERIVEEPLRRSVWALVILGAFSLAGSVVLSFWFGRAFTAASTDLTQNALALGRGERRSPLRSGVTEFKAVDEALTAASIELEDRAQQRAEVASQASG